MKKPKNKTMSTYTVAEINEQQAILMARGGQDAYKNNTDNKFYTYTDLAPDAPEVEITETQNEEMFLVTWNGTFPVYKKRKMFPRN